MNIKLNEHAEKAMKILAVPDLPQVMCPNTLELDIRDRLPGLSDEEVRIVVELIKEYR